jgi:hypothetical protein
MVKMFATRRIWVVKQESQVDSLKDVTVNQDVVAYEYTDGCLRLIVDIAPGRTVDIRCNYHEEPDAFPDSESISYRLGVAVRRYLSEPRDNYGSSDLFRFRL